MKRPLGREVFVANIDGTKVVVKRFNDENSAQTVNNLKAELALMSQTMGSGINQINQCLHALPEVGIAVLSFAPGHRLSDAIAASNYKHRRKLIKHAGNWLAQYTAIRKRETTFAPKYWVKNLKGNSTLHTLSIEDRKLLETLIHVLQTQIPRIRGCNVIRAAVHGDFVGTNMHYHNGVLYGVDIQGECWHPIAKEAANFLVWQQIHSLQPAPKTRHGIALHDWEAFLESGAVSNNEQFTTLPFFIGVHLFKRFLEIQSEKVRKNNIRVAIRNYIEPDNK